MQSLLMLCNIFNSLEPFAILLTKFRENSFGISLPEKKKIQYLSWEVVTLPKSQGGLGICKAHDKNLALLASLSWRLFLHPNTLWAQTLINKYNSSKNKIFHAFIWESVLRGGNLCSKAIAWTPGTNSSIDLWEPRCIPQSPTLRASVHGPLNSHKIGLKISHI